MSSCYVENYRLRMWQEIRCIIKWLLYQNVTLSACAVNRCTSCSSVAFLTRQLLKEWCYCSIKLLSLLPPVTMSGSKSSRTIYVRDYNMKSHSLHILSPNEGIIEFHWHESVTLLLIALWVYWTLVSESWIQLKCKLRVSLHPGSDAVLFADLKTGKRRNINIIP